MRKIVGAILVFFTMIPVGAAQEVVLPLKSNPAITNLPQSKSTLQEPELPLMLPFRDDFSYQGPYPDPLLWEDRAAFVNQSFAVHPPTIGVATLDALDADGMIYDQASDNSFPFAADQLTSHPIRLDSIFSPVAAALEPADSVILSFYYQPQGLGGAPAPEDSLAVQFLHTPGHYTPGEDGRQQWVDDLWVTVWSTGGENLETFSGNQMPYFQQVAIPVDDPAYFREDFRFRFQNYVRFKATKDIPNYAGNNYIWNIDYVTLGRGGSVFQSNYYDIAFASPAQSLLEGYTAMPWTHYIINPQGFLKDNFALNITNLGAITYNYEYRYVIMDEGDNVIRTYSGGTWNIAPFSQTGYLSYAPHSNPMVLPNPLPTAPAAQRTFTIVHSLKEGANGDSYRSNDTTTYKQVFSNYFAYDDGVPESTYGVLGYTPKVAYQFAPAHTDTLEAVEIFFNRTVNDRNVTPFYLTIWSSLDPEVILYESEVMTPEFGEGINNFTSYLLEEPVLVSDSFFVGWRQTEGDVFLGVGFDRNNNAGQHIFFNADGQWQPSVEQGALMIRPLFASSPTTSTGPTVMPRQFSLYPNPAGSGTLNIQLRDALAEQPGLLEVAIFDMQGRMVYSGKYNNNIDISPYQNGLYTIRITNPQSRQSHSERFIIAR
ncbi:MAG: T9SS type A sorting domain-containing protein [Bacteroidales bacterium]